MFNRPPRRRTIAIIAATLIVGLVGLCAALSSTWYLAADYPGAELVSSETMVRTTAGLAVKRTNSYRSSDPFPAIYNWYSQRFDLGPESHAQGTCILMARSFTSFWLLREQITVTLCGTPNGQMMFVSRSSVLPYGQWLGR
jgi:hypothetical protein